MNKNPVVYEEDLAVPNTVNKQQKNNVNKFQEPKAKTSINFYQSNHDDLHNMEKKSREAEVNDFLFNYKQQAKEKK